MLWRHFLTVLPGSPEKVITNFIPIILQVQTINRSKRGNPILAVLAEVADAHPPPPELPPNAFLEVLQEQSAPAFCFQLRHQVEVHVVWPSTAEERSLWEVQLHQLFNGLREVLFTLAVTLAFPNYVDQVLPYPGEDQRSIPAQNAEDVVVPGRIEVGAEVGVEGVLVSEFGMPEQAFQGRQHFAIDVALQCLHLSSMAVDLLDEVPILSEELTDWPNSRKYDFGFQRYYYLDGRPPTLILRLSQAEQEWGAIQLYEIADPPESQFVIVEHQVEVLRLPAVIPHVEGDVHQTIIETSDWLLDWEILLLSSQYVSTHLFALGENGLQVTIKPIDGIAQSILFGEGCLACPT
jgi:hypothetical protein